MPLHWRIPTMSINHYENFPVGSWALPRRLRPAVHAIYRFARTADDLADEDEGEATPAERLAALAAYRQALARIEAGDTPADDPVFTPLAAAIAAHQADAPAAARPSAAPQDAAPTAAQASAAVAARAVAAFQQANGVKTHVGHHPRRWRHQHRQPHG